jgi:hypothetical protein
MTTTAEALVRGCTRGEQAERAALVALEAVFCLGAEAAATICERRAADHGALLECMADVYDEARARVVVLAAALDGVGGG